MELLSDKITGDQLTAAEFAQAMKELENLITDTGQTLTNTDLMQVGKSIAAYVANADMYTDSGAADAYVLSSISGFEPPFQYADGMVFRFIPANNNTGGAVTANPVGLGARAVVLEAGGSFSANTEFVPGIMVTIRFDSGANNFKLLRIRDAGNSVDEVGLTRTATQSEVNTGTESFAYVSPDTLSGRTATDTRTGIAELATQAEVNTGTDANRIVTPNTLSGRTATLTRSGLAELATQAEVDTGVDADRIVTPATLNDRNATETLTGIAEIATQAEVTTGTDDTRIVTPLKLETRLASQLAGLGSDDINNDSTVPGGDVSAALEVLQSNSDTSIYALATGDDVFSAVGTIVDPDLQITGLTVQDYEVEVFAMFTTGTGSGDPGLRFRFDMATGLFNIGYGGSVTVNGSNGIGTHTGAAGRNTDSNAATYSTTVGSIQSQAGENIIVWWKGRLDVTSVGGTLQCFWGKDSAVSRNLTRLEGSYMKVRPLVAG